MIDNIIAYIVEKHINDDTVITQDTELISSGLIDSINTLALVDYIETKYNIELEAREVNRENLNTPKLIEALILKKQGKIG